MEFPPTAQSIKELFQPQHPALIVPLTATDFGELSAQTATIPSTADLVEWRVDQLKDLQPELIISAAQFLKENLPCPLLITLRSVNEGGAGPDGSEYAELVSLILRHQLADLIDIEAEQPAADKLLVQAKTAQVPVILSRHFFDPEQARAQDSDRLYQLFMSGHERGADIVKVAVWCEDSAHLISLLTAAYWYSEEAGPEYPIIMIGMGKAGIPTRLMGGFFGSSATFVQRPLQPVSSPMETVPPIDYSATDTPGCNINPPDQTGSSAPGQIDFHLTEKVLSIFGQREKK